MSVMYASDWFQLKPRSVSYLREEVYVSAYEMQRVGLSQSTFGVLELEPDFPGPPSSYFPVRIVPDTSMKRTNSVYINQAFAEAIGFLDGDQRYWTIRQSPSVIQLSQIVIELAVETDEC